MVDDPFLLDSKYEAISTLFIYAILEQGQQQQVANSILPTLQALGPRRMVAWDYIRPYTPTLFRGPNTPSMDSLIILLSPYIDWEAYHSKNDIIRWAAAALAVPYTEEVGRDIVSALLQISMYDSLLPHIPLNIWMWLKRHSTLPPLYRGLWARITSSTVRYIRGLDDIQILKSFFILAWSGDNAIDCEDYMKDLLREDFCGIGMWGHRKDLVERLDGCSQMGCYSSQYRSLMNGLLEVETEAAKTLIRTLSELSFSISMLIHATGNAHRIALHLHLCSAPPLPMTSPHHVVNVWLHCHVLVLPPHPFRSSH